MIKLTNTHGIAFAAILQWATAFIHAIKMAMKLSLQKKIGPPVGMFARVADELLTKQHAG
jgi:hypothetical protein